MGTNQDHTRPMTCTGLPRKNAILGSWLTHCHRANTPTNRPTCQKRKLDSWGLITDHMVLPPQALRSCWA